VPTRSETRRIHTTVVGASAGGVEALRNLVAALPADFPGAVLVVLHVAPTTPSVLPQILTRAGEIPAAHAVDGETIEPGRIYVAPPDRHLLVGDGRILLDRGPRIHGYRPAVDSLFRSAAEACGGNAVGVVLSGVLDDGTAGLLAIKRAGGTAFVQDPGEALYPAMPKNAIEFVVPDLVATAGAIGEAIAALASSSPRDPPQDGVHGVSKDSLAGIDRETSDAPQPGSPTGLSCPECDGAIWESVVDGLPHYACRVGHEYAPEAFDVRQSQRVEAALWTALRALEERAVLHRRIAARQQAHGNQKTAERFGARAEQSVRNALLIRELLGRFDAEEGAA
jgi:two-component system, chemotaxis family, protein-glutamate methylesterase/glutaminase